MNFLLTITCRNLLRRRRRSILLGSAIAFGTAVLVLANAFAHGISELFFNELMTGWTGHVSVYFITNGDGNNSIFHDAERMRAIVRERLPGVKRADEIISIQTRAIGIGKTDNLYMVGLPVSIDHPDKNTLHVLRNFPIIEGSFDALCDTAIEHPVGLAVEKAKAFNVKLHDIIRVRYFDKYGRTRAARLTVAAIFKPSNFIWGAMAILDVKQIKKLAGFGPHDIGTLYLTLDNPRKNAKRLADSLHAGLTPPLAVIDGKLNFNDTTVAVTLLSLRTDSASLALADSEIHCSSRIPADSMHRKRTVIVSSMLADSAGVKPGDTVSCTFAGKFDDGTGHIRLIVTAIAAPGCVFDGPVILVNENAFYKAFYDCWPASVAAGKGPFRPDSSLPVYRALGGEWLLVDRPKTTDDFIRFNREIRHKGWKAAVVNVGSMYETASIILNLEIALNMVSLVCFVLLFFIILIGVVNTLRMTIRERIREIGTMRAIGMQRLDVRNLFLIETGMLASISAAAGTAIAFAAMFGMSRLAFKTENNPLSMLLVDGHIVFAPTPMATVIFMTVIVMIAVATAYFPAKRAADLTAAESLRHFE